MKKLLILVISITMLAALSACKQDGPIQEDKTRAKASSADKQSVILVNEKTHAFSDPTKQDTFRITIAGDSVLTSKAVLEIIKFDGSVLYQDTFASNYLIDYGIVENPTAVKMEAYILQRANTFFHNDNFMQPALPTDRTFDPNYSDKQVWDIIKSDSSAIGFYYKLGKEDGRYLAYSGSEGKVVMYINCC